MFVPRNILRNGLKLSNNFQRMYRAAQIQDYGAEITIQDIKDKNPSDHEVLIKNETAGINHADWMMRQGKYHIKPPLPFTPGGESIGIVESVGKKIKHWAEGDRVLVLKQGFTGAFAEKTIADENFDIIVKLPYSLDIELAPALGAYATAYLGMKKMVTENRGNSFLILSSQGTLGFAAMDLAQNVFEGMVFGASDSEEKLSIFREANVMSTFNWTDNKLARNVREKTFGKGVDFVIDTVGGDVFNQAKECLKDGGHILSLGFSSLVIPQLDLLDLHRLNASISAVWLHGKDKKDIVSAIEMISKMFDDGFLSGIKIRQYPLDDINKCYHDVQDSKFFGKAVLTMY
jgi:NADPH2:quinone reductase|uniref:Enoyl reductase (ER) domain-containing protein n=1 Tax=Panagrolaimus sp. PS1159 TaxID=55785 RepID=A0AC35FXG6_9BILA